MNVAYNYDRRDEESGLKAVPKVASVVFRKRNNFRDALFDLESDQYMVRLFSAGSAARGGEGRGQLNFVLGQFHNFTEKYLKNNENFFDRAAQLQDLSAIFNKMMNQIVNKWPEIAAQGYQWETLCGSIQKYMLELADILGIRNELADTIANWFNAYREIQENELKYGQRDRLAAEALLKHQQLAYLKTTGHDTNQVQSDVRMRIAHIDNELTKLPAHPEHEPVFTARKPDQRAAVPMTTEGKTPSAWTQYAKNPPVMPVSGPQKVTGWRAAAKKIPLLGRFF